MRTFSVPGTAPAGCAVDPKTGDLAITSYGDKTGTNANLAIFRKAKGMPDVYTDPDLLNYINCVYDSAGNLFVDGTYPHGYYGAKLAELRRKGSSLHTINLDYDPGWLGGVQWDGKYLAVGQSVLPYILRYKIAKGSGTFVDKIRLTDSYAEQNFLLVGKQAIVANVYYYSIYIPKFDVLVYDYPEGGYSTNEIMASSAQITSLALSRGRP
jgi:hypothetical protein